MLRMDISVYVHLSLEGFVSMKLTKTRRKSAGIEQHFERLECITFLTTTSQLLLNTKVLL